MTASELESYQRHKTVPKLTHHAKNLWIRHDRMSPIQRVTELNLVQHDALVINDNTAAGFSSCEAGSIIPK